jgi:hypothetical protein
VDIIASRNGISSFSGAEMNSSKGPSPPKGLRMPLAKVRRCTLLLEAFYGGLPELSMFYAMSQT